MLDSDSERPMQNSLHRRFDQLKKWEKSDTFHETNAVRDAVKVKFPMGTQFLAACSSGDIEEAARLLRKGVDVNTANVDGLTALHQACIDNDLELVEFLIKNGCDIDVKDNEGWTPLHATASCAYIEVAKFLISEGADLAAVNNDGDLSVDLADNHEMEAMLTDEMQRRGIDLEKARGVEEQRMRKDAQRWVKSNRYVELLDPKSGASPLHVAAAKGYMEVLQLILQCPNVNPNCRDNDGWTPLHAAAHWGQERACELLCEHGGDMSATTNASQDIFEVAEPDLLPMLRMLKNKQMSRRLAASSEIAEPPPRKEGTGKRRSSVTRMSVDQKASVTSKIAEQEGIAGGAGDASTITLPSPVEEEAAGVRPWVKRRQQLAAAVEAEVPPKVERKEQEEEPTPTPAKPAEPPAAAPAAAPPTPSTAAAAAAALSSASSTATAAAAAAASRARAEMAKKPTTLENVAEEQQSSPEKSAESPKKGSPDAAPEDDSNKTNGVEAPMTGPPAHLLNQRRLENRRADKRVSAVMAPMKGEESETQRSARARHARATRRSTQGVSQDELQEAKKLLQTDPARPAPPATSDAKPTEEKAAERSTTERTAPERSTTERTAPERAVRDHNGTSAGTDSTDGQLREAPKQEKSSDPISSTLPTTRSRRHQRRHQPTDPSTSTESSSTTQPSDPVRTEQPGRSEAPTSLSRYSRPSSTIEASPAADKAPSPSSWRTRAGLSSTYNSSLSRTPTFHGTTTASSPSDRQSDEASEGSASSRLTWEDDLKARRRARRGERPPPGKPTDSTGPPSDAGRTDSGRYSLHGDSTDNLRSSSQLRPNSYHDSARPYSSRWGSSSDSGAPDYKKLYEQEKLESERLRKELEQAKKDLTDSRSDADRLRKAQGSSSVDTRRMERKLSEYEEEIKLAEKLRAENEKLKAENRALARVVARLSREQ